MSEREQSTITPILQDIVDARRLCHRAAHHYSADRDRAGMAGTDPEASAGRKKLHEAVLRYWWQLRDPTKRHCPDYYYGRVTYDWQCRDANDDLVQVQIDDTGDAHRVDTTEMPVDGDVTDPLFYGHVDGEEALIVGLSDLDDWQERERLVGDNVDTPDQQGQRVRRVPVRLPAQASLRAMSLMDEVLGELSKHLDAGEPRVADPVEA